MVALSPDGNLKRKKTRFLRTICLLESVKTTL